MFQKVKVPLLFFIVLGFVFIACQKQQDITKESPQIKNNNTARLITDMPEKDYSIPLSTAAHFTRNWREHKKAEDPISFEVPVGGLQQIMARAARNNIDITHINFYLAINDEGKRTMVYVAKDKDGNDILEYPIKEQINGHDVLNPAGDETHDCPGTCIIAPNVLNGN